MEAAELITAQYMTRFACIGGECEDHCCSGWNVLVDKPHYDALRARLEATKAGRQEFQRSLAILNDGKDALNYAEIKMGDGDAKNCPFLQQDKLCSVHARFGGQLLSHTCAQYPRKLQQVGPRREMWAALSCPEAARLCLLRDDAMDIVDGTRDDQHRVLTRILPDERPLPYARFIDDIRGAGYRLLSLRQYPMSTRLFFVGYFANRTAAAFHRDAPVVDERWLAGELDRISDDAVLAELAAAAKTLTVPKAQAVTLVTELMASCAKSRHLGALVRDVLVAYGAGDGTTAVMDEATAARVWDAYQQRKDRLEAAHAARVDLFLENYCKNFWMRDWYVETPNLLVYAQRLFLFVAALRFLLVSHPSLPADAAADTATLDTAVVQVVYRFSRSVEHNPTLLAAIETAFRTRGMQDFAHTASLALV